MPKPTESEDRAIRKIAPLPRSSNLVCAHCGLPIQRQTSVTVESLFCCTGCELLYRTLHSMGLEEFYRYSEISVRPFARPSQPSGESYRFLDDPELLAQLITKGSNDIVQASLYLEGVHCAGCVWLLEKLPKLHEGVQASSLDPTQGILRFAFDPRATGISAIARTLDRLGYRAHAPLRGEIEASAKEADRTSLTRIAVAGFCAMNVMTMSVSLHQGLLSGIDGSVSHLFRWTSLLLTLPVIFYAAMPFYERALRSLRRGILHIDLPIVIALIVSFAYSAWSTVVAGRVYFDSIDMIIFLLLTGRHAQQRALMAARRESTKSVQLLPARARVVEHGEVREVSVRNVIPGMEIEVRAGERVPADGIVSSGTSFIDSSILTGESRFLPITTGDEAHAGTLNVESALVIRVTRGQDSSRIARILRLADEQIRKRPALVTLMDRAAPYFTAGLLVLSLATFFLWLHSGVAIALDRTVALLLVACPCALGLAATTTFSVALGKAARMGILIHDADTLEKLSRVRAVYLDKTGTLTEGFRRVTSVSYLETNSTPSILAGHLRCLAAVAPRHPVAAALWVWAAANCGNPEPPLFAQSSVVPGRGMKGEDMEGNLWIAGSLRWFEELGVSLPKEAREIATVAREKESSVVMLAKNGNILAIFEIDDTPKDFAKDALAGLRRLRREPLLLSGDTKELSIRIGMKLGLEERFCRGGLFPEEKQAVVQSDSRSTAMVGDGINDAAAMGAADVAIGVRGGLESMLEVADVFLAENDTRLIPATFEGADRTIRLIKINLALSACYNVLAAGAAMAGLVDPLVAAVLMPISSVGVIALAAFAKTFGKSALWGQ